MDTVVVLDTNVLLADPNSVLSFPRADVVIPETVLGELDKLKTARVDPDLRFRGREVSRILFDLSEEGSLVDGVELPDGGTLRVVPFDSDCELPSGLQTRNADDRILAAVYQTRAIYGDDVEIALVTNDLNMLLKAQTLGIQVRRYGDGLEAGFARRYIIRPFQRYRIPITILAVAMAVLVGVILIAVFANRGNTSTTISNIPSEYKDVLTTGQQKAFDALNTLQTQPNDPESLRTMANYYYDRRAVLSQSDPVAALDDAQKAVRYFQRYLAVSPTDMNAVVDLAVLEFYTGQPDQAIKLVSDVLAKDKANVNANFNLGVFLWQSRRADYAGALAQFEKVVALTQNDPHMADTLARAKANIEQLKKDAQAAGRSLDATQATDPGTVTTP
jgi:tetratricopeptide (TPR) repeat protein